MSWFGFGGSSNSDSDRAPEVPVRVDNFVEDDFSNVPSSSGMDFASPGGGNFQEQLMMEQQKMILQAVVLKLTDLAFDRCITKPSTSVSYSEQNCITASVGKYVDTTQLVMKRFQMAQDGSH